MDSVSARTDARSEPSASFVSESRFHSGIPHSLRRYFKNERRTPRSRRFSYSGFESALPLAYSSRCRPDFARISPERVVREQRSAV